ncbi:MrcB family domain-containing protein [Mesobacillus jeotgali]|uniref:MrcB family domain-containing protein n=1 Tax=Mesobacillus jeotgali TaxID=129985 RepID=UPI0009A6AB68|nr:DUF3578 domain-containing protein [Mesobacillus jeotgali]
MNKHVFLNIAKRVNKIKTLGTNKYNLITNVNNQEIYLETEASRAKFKSGEKANPFENISFKFINRAWEEFIIARQANSHDFQKARGHSSFIIAFFSQLPFVEVVNRDNKIGIKLKEFHTDDIPSEQYQKVKLFLDEVLEAKYDPKNLSGQIDGNLYRVKSRGRQDSRLLGFIDEYNNINNSQFNLYKKADNKDEYMKSILINVSYFKMALMILDLLSNISKKEKKAALEEIGMLIVRNSRGDNLMVESVAKERTHNLLKWLESTNLIDYNWTPYEKYFDVFNKKENSMESNLRESLLKMMNEYLQAKREPFGGHPLGTFIRNDVPVEFTRLPFVPPTDYVVTGSVGQGVWAHVPWIAIMNRSVTVSTQRGYYIVYLFSEDMSSVYLTLAQGVTETSREAIQIIKEEIRRSVPLSSKVRKDDDFYLGNSPRAKAYAQSTALYIPYDNENMPDESELLADLEEMINIYENFISIKNGSVHFRYEGDIMSENPHDVTREKFEYLSYNDLVTYIYSFIKGKGFYYEKEEVINLFLSLKTKPFVIISGISGTGKTKIVQWFAESVGATEKNGQFSLIPIRPDWNDGSDLLGYVDIKGEFKEGPLTKVIKNAHLNPDLPYFVLLDEMNLARVEYYFSDILSVMESRKWENGEVVSSTLLSSDVYGEDLTLPNNLYIIGTVNMDETTHPFSKKVLDRANTIEFNRVNLGNLAFLTELEEVEPKVIGHDRFASKYLHLKDVYKENKELVTRATDELVKINESLQLINAHVGYRVRDEICFYLAYNEESNLMKFENAFDHCIMQKILPRIAGSDTRVEQLLRELYSLFANKDYEEDGQNDIQNAKYPRSAAKVAEMLGRLRNDGFTSFWIS